MEVSSQLHAPAALPQGKEAGWPQSRSGRGGDEKNSQPPPPPRRESNHRTPIVQPVAQRYTDWAITALMLIWWK
jgi:hypothetical protein